MRNFNLLSNLLKIVNEKMQKSNGKIIKLPEMFEINYPKRVLNIQECYFSLEVNIYSQRETINSDSICRMIKFVDIWNSSKDYVEIDIPIQLPAISHNTHQQSQQFNQNGMNFDLSISFKLENKLLFSYSNSNLASDLLAANCIQQEFYSSVSVNPVFIPLK
jgi:hypothetical protein